MDLKKEIKLSDLAKLPRRAKKPAARKLKGTGARPARALPRKAARELVGLKIGATQLAASRVSNNGSPHVLQLAREELPAGIVVGGEVRDVPALASALDEFFTKHELPRRGVRLGVATNRIGVRAFEIAGVDDDRQLANAVRFRAHEAVSIPLDQAVLDYHVLSETVDEAGKLNRRILVVAAYRDSIDRYTDAFNEAGIELAAIDLEAFALLRAVAAPAASSGSPRGRGRRRHASATSARRSRSRTAPSATSCASSSGAGRRSPARSSASSASPPRRPRSSSAASRSRPAPHDDERASRARQVVRSELQTLARELVASLHFYQGQPGSLAIGEILLSGGTSRMAGLAEELERLTRVGVRQADPLTRAKVADSVQAGDDLPSLTVAIGLGVED